MKFNIPKLLEFFDDPDTKTLGGSATVTRNRRHVSSINGLIGEDIAAGAFVHFMSNHVKVLDGKVTERKRGGKWLDRWIVDEDNKILYQCEIKSWSASSLGGKALALNPDEENLKAVVTIITRSYTE